MSGIASSGCMSAGMAYLASVFPDDKERGTAMGKGESGRGQKRRREIIMTSVVLCFSGFVMSGIGIGVLTGPLLGSQL